MQRIWTTLVGCFDVPPLGASLLALGACSLPGCVFNGSGAGTTEVALDTGDLTTDVSGAETSTGAPDPGDTSAADTSTSPADDETSSSSGAPLDPETGSSSTTGADAGDSGQDLCGNGQVDPGEACDGDLVPASCAEIDPAYTDGAPTCDDTCQLDISACVTCQAPTIKPCDEGSDEPLHALELGCDSIKGWTPADAVHLEDKTIAALDATSYRVVRRFGSHPDAWTPHAGSKALLIGTGSFEPADANGVVTDKAGDAQYGGSNLNPDGMGMFPAIPGVQPVNGGSAPFVDCDGEHDCSNTLSGQWKALSPKDARDVFWLAVDTVVPTGTHGFALDLAFFTAHYPEYNFNSYNDMVVLWMHSEAYVGNISFRRDGNKYGPLSLPTLTDAGWMIHDGSKDPALAGTGYDSDPNKLGSQGGASAWMTVEGPAVPGETLTLTLAIMDLEDGSIDSAILVDNFRWSCAACDLTQTCGLRLADDI